MSDHDNVDMSFYDAHISEQKHKIRTDKYLKFYLKSQRAKKFIIAVMIGLFYS